MKTKAHENFNVPSEKKLTNCDAHLINFTYKGQVNVMTSF